VKLTGRIVFRLSDHASSMSRRWLVVALRKLDSGALAWGFYGEFSRRNESLGRRHPALRFSAADEREWFQLAQTVQGLRARDLPSYSGAEDSALDRALVLGDKCVSARTRRSAPSASTRIVPN